MKDSPKGPDRSALFEVASEQAGYFSSEQARRAGYSPALTAYHARRGTFVRVARGLYRLRDYPSSPREGMFIAWLALGRDAAISHETALEIFDLADIIPHEIHVTVPRSRKVTRRLAGVRIHTTVRPLIGDQVVVREGLRVTAPARTIVDVAESGAGPEQITAAVEAAVRRGLTTPARLHAAASGASNRVRELLELAIPGGASQRYRSPAAFRRALETRLQRLSAETGRSILRLRKEVVFDRLLARLFAAPDHGWVLKGALALDYRFGDRARTTRDVDLATTDEAAAVADLIAAQGTDLGDFFEFAIERVGKLEEEQGEAIRFHVVAELAGRVFDEFALDVGFDPPSRTEPVEGPDLLGFAGIDPVVAPAIPLSVQVAEKVHALTRIYGAGQRPSTRVKDLVDLYLISEEAALDGRTLRIDLEGTFAQRASHELPPQLPEPPASWRTPYRRLATEVGVDPDIEVGLKRARAFIEPVLQDRSIFGTWNPSHASWVSA